MIVSASYHVPPDELNRLRIDTGSACEGVRGCRLVAELCGTLREHEGDDETGIAVDAFCFSWIARGAAPVEGEVAIAIANSHGYWATG